MGVNLLPEASTKDFKKTDSSIRGLVMLVVWVGILIVIFVVLFFNKGIENSRLRQAEADRTSLLSKITSLGEKHDDYYTLAYKSIVLTRVKTDQYIPSTIGSYIKQQIEAKGKISTYYFNAKGEIRLQIESDTYFKAVQIWHALIKDKNIMTELNLTSFSQDPKTGVVRYELQGLLNLDQLYQQNGITK
jgi:hypothetical protein